MSPKLREFLQDLQRFHTAYVFRCYKEKGGYYTVFSDKTTYVGSMRVVNAAINAGLVAREEAVRLELEHPWGVPGPYAGYRAWYSWNGLLVDDYEAELTRGTYAAFVLRLTDEGRAQVAESERGSGA